MDDAGNIRNVSMSSRSSRRAADPSSLPGTTRDSESPLTLSSEDLSTRSASPRFNSTLDNGDK